MEWGEGWGGVGVEGVGVGKWSTQAPCQSSSQQHDPIQRFHGGAGAALRCPACSQRVQRAASLLRSAAKTLAGSQQQTPPAYCT